MKKMRKILLFFFLSVFFDLTSFYPTQAEIIDIQNEEKNFGDWKVFCEIDAMMSIAHCKIASKFYENTASITIEPTAKFLGQLFMVIPQIKVGSFVKIRVDQNDLILSKNISPKDFGLIPLSDEQKNELYRQIKNGDSLFLRFDIKNSEKEITIKISLKDFRSALSYFNSRASK
jgi:invasion protein IalB